MRVCEARERLQNLGAYLRQMRRNPGSVGYYMCQFADYLAGQLKGEVITADEFLLAVELAFADLRRGTHPFTGEMITHVAVDRTPATEMFIRMYLPDAYAAIFPAEFAEELARVTAEVRASIEADSKLVR